MDKEWLKLSYDQIINKLLDKYGKVEGNYFLSEDSLKPNQEIKRGSQGLYIHHTNEDKAIELSNSESVMAYKYPFDWQLAENLVYCNLLEHLLLHVKIVEKDIKMKGQQRLSPIFAVGIGGVLNFLLPELLDIYSGIKYKASWKKEVVKQVINYREEFIDIVIYLQKLNGYEWDEVFGIKSFYRNKYIWDEEQNDELINEIIDKAGRI